MGALDDLLKQNNAAPMQNRGSALDNLLAAPSPSSPGSAMDRLLAGEPVEQSSSQFDPIDIIKQPAAAAMEALSYLDKPRGAIAGAVKAGMDGGDIIQGAQTGWKENTSWGELLPQDFRKENPITSGIVGFATDVLLDPLTLIPPAKAASALRIPQTINKGIEAAKGTETGAKVIAALEDYGGVNRIKDIQQETRAARAADQVLDEDVVDQIKVFTKEQGNNAGAKLTDYVEATVKPAERLELTPSMQKDILDATENNKAIDLIKQGVVSKEDVFDTLRNSGKEVPDYLLQEHQRVAKQAGKEIPDYVYRDDVLNSIPDENVRTSIQRIGDMIAKKSQQYGDELNSRGMLSDDAMVRFSDGSHLRRSLLKYESPEEFLAAVKKNGTDEEWRKAYVDYQQSKQGMSGMSAAHKVNKNDFIQRQVLSPETLEKLGEIKDPAYRAMDTLSRGSKALREDEFLTKVAQRFGVSEEEAARLSRSLPERRQYVKVPEDSKAYRALAGQWVPKDVFEQVRGTVGTKEDNMNQTWSKLVSWWKVGKLAAPAPIMRNFYSGLPMANVYGQVPLYAMPKYMAKIFSEYQYNGKKNAPILRELRSTGILDDAWNKQELRNIISGNAAERYKASKGIDKAKAGIEALADKGMEYFGTPDKFWRAVTYAYHRDKGKSVKEAAEIAQKALLDYTSTPEWVNWLSKSGLMPFARFPYLAGKATIEAAYNNPASLSKYYKINNQTSDNQDAILPEYLKSKTLLPLWDGTQTVQGKERPVKNNIDLSYILPFATDVKLGNPLIEAAYQVYTGRNSSGMDVVRPGMTPSDKLAAIGKNVAGSTVPTVVSPYTWEKLYGGITGQVDAKGRQYDPYSGAAQALLGLKNVPINIDEMYKQKHTQIQSQQRAISAEISRIQKDQRLTQEQRKEQIEEYKKQMLNLGKEGRKAAEAYKKEKARANP